MHLKRSRNWREFDPLDYTAEDAHLYIFYPRRRAPGHRGVYKFSSFLYVTRTFPSHILGLAIY